MKLSLIVLSILITVSVHAQNDEFLSRVNETYLRTDKNFDIDCYYSWNKTYKLITPAGVTRKEGNTLSRDFLIESSDGKIPMVFTLKRDKKNFSYEAVLDKVHFSRNELAKRDFFLAPLFDKKFEAQFETTKILCSVNFAYALPFVLEDGDYHFSVHPQKNYDWQSRLTAGIEIYLNDFSHRSVIFLENGNNRGNLVNLNDFFDNKEPKLPQYKFESSLINVPADTPLIVSPAGNNRFKINARNEINIKFTGGNHNYCVWNVARHVLEDLMNSTSNARINFNYDMSLLVAQQRGVEGMKLDFPKNEINRSNLLKDLLVTPERQKKYHDAYIQYFMDYLAREYKAMYKSYTIQYSAPGYNKKVVLQGNGSRDLLIEFNY